MGEVISFVGQKGGTGKSTLARAFAVEAARAQTNVLIADLDDAQRTSFEWGQRRIANGFKPIVNVERVPRLQLFTRAAAVDVLVVDAPGWADASTVWLAQGSQLTVLSTGGGVDDLNPTIRLMHELMGKDIPQWRVALALCRVQNEAEVAFARDYLRQAKYKALKGELYERKSFRDLQNLGQSVTENSASALAREARELVESIGVALARAQTLQRAIDKERAPARLVGREGKGRER
jgi:chromosome partitioning protein